MNVLGIDIGGSALKGAPVDTTTGALLAERHRIETPDLLTPKEMGLQIVAMVHHFKWTGPIGIGFPGVIHGSTVLTSANLHKAFVGCDVGKEFTAMTGLKVSVVNDADAAGIAEMKFGAGRDVGGTVLLLTLGTGVGSALFYRGVLYPNSELGHLPIRGRSAERFIAASRRKERDLSWTAYGKELSQYLHILEKILWPELIIIGGGISAKHEKFFKYLKTRAKTVPAEFFNESGIVGAALWHVM